MAKTYMKDGLEYTASNYRMRYNPEYHENQSKPYKTRDLVYLCIMWESMKKADIAAALGRTPGAVLAKANELKKNGLYETYKKMADKF